MSKKRGIVFLVLLSLSMILVAGCGKDETKKMTTLDEVKKRGKIIVGTEAVVYPYEFVENGKIVGYSSEILAEVVKALGVELEQHDVEWKGILPGLESKKFDIIATSIASTVERKEKYGLTVPIGEFIHVFNKNATNEELTSKDQLGNKKIGCVIGSINERLLKDLQAELEKEGKPSFELVYFNGIPEAFIDLENNRIDAVLCSETTAMGIMEKNPNTYATFDILKTSSREFVTWAVRKEDKELLEFINAEIIKLKKNGKLAELQEKWFGHTLDLPDNI